MRPRALVGIALYAVVLSSCKEVVRPPAEPTHPLVCDEAIRGALGEVKSLQQQGKLELALQKAIDAESLCDPFVDEQREAQLEILRDLADDEQAHVLAKKILDNPKTAPALVIKVKALLAEPIRARSQGDLREADELRSKGENDAARAAYLQVLNEHPRDPMALTALGEVEMARNDMSSARRYFARAIRATGRTFSAGVFSPEISNGPHIQGPLLPERKLVGVLHRTTPSGGSFSSLLVGPQSSVTKDKVLAWGEGIPLTLASADGRDTRAIQLSGIRDFALAPGEGSSIVAALSTEGVSLIDLTSGEIKGRAPAKGQSLKFASPTRLFVGKQAFKYPELSPLYSLGIEDNEIVDDSKPYALLSDILFQPNVIVALEHRMTPRGKKQAIVVRKTEDGTTVLDKELGDEDSQPLLDIHPSGKYVGWVGQAYSNVETQGGIVDVATGKVTSFGYRGVAKSTPGGIRVSADGKAACIFNSSWVPSRRVGGKVTHCWVRNHEAIVMDIPKTPGFEPQSQGSLSPDGKLAVFCEQEDTKRLKFQVAVRVVEVATGKTLNRFVVGKAQVWTADAVFVSNGVVRVDISREEMGVHIDAKTGARVQSPPDASEPDLGIRDLEAPAVGERLLRDRSTVSLDGGAIAVRVSPALKGEPTKPPTSCWTTDLKKSALEVCAAEKKHDITVSDGSAKLVKERLPIRLSMPIKSAKGALITVGQVEVMAIQDQGMVRYFARSGKLIGTVVALGPESLAAFLADGTVELLGEGTAKTEDAICVASDVVMPIEACADQRAVEGALVKIIETLAK